MNLKDLTKLAGLKLSELATQTGMEYSHVSTAVTMDEKGEIPKRQSVRDRQIQLRDYLETLLKVNERMSDENNPKRRAEIWDNEREVARRYPAPPGCTQELVLDDFKLGSYVRLRLSPGEDAVLCRFLRVVTRGEHQHVDVIEQAVGACRSMTVEQVRAGGR